MMAHPTKPPAGHAVAAGIYQCHLPGFGLRVVYIDLIGTQINSHVGLMQKVIGEKLFDDIPLCSPGK